MQSSLYNLNRDFVSTLFKLRRILKLKDINIPVISRDDESFINYWLFNSNHFGHSPLDYLRYNGIELHIIANNFEVENGVYTGNVSPSKNSSILFSKDSLITLDKGDKYMIGGRKRLILVDNEEIDYLKGKKLDENLFLINIQNKKNLQKEIEKGAMFIS